MSVIAAGSVSDERLTSPLPLATNTAFFDGLRGLAALYVLLRHAAIMLVIYVALNPPQHGMVRALILAFKTLSYPHVAVLFFFVLSGFVIHLRCARELHESPRTATFAWRGFMWRRVRRLYPPLLAALALTAVVDQVGLSYDLPVYKTEPGMPHYVVTPALEWRDLIGSALFLNNLWPGVNAFGTDSPLWSLALEWWFYCLYPIFWYLSRKSIGLATGVVILLYAASLAAAPYPWLKFPSRVFSQFPLWWTGALLADVYTGRIKIRHVTLAPLIILLPLGMYVDAKVKRMEAANRQQVMVAPDTLTAVEMQTASAEHTPATTNPASLPPTPSGVGRVPAQPTTVQVSTNPSAMAVLKRVVPRHASDMVFVLGIVGLISTLFVLQERGWSMRPLEKLKPLGDMSYTLYLTHMPIVVFVGGWFMAKDPMHRPGYNILPWALTCVFCIVVAYLIHLFAERPFTGRKGKRKSMAPAQ